MEEMERNPDTLKAISTAAQALIEIEAEIEQAKADLEKKVKDWRQVAEHDIPDLMRQVGLESFKMESGESLSVKSDLYVSENVPASKMEAIVDFLIKAEAPELIRYAVTVLYPHDQKEKAEASFKWCKNKGMDVALQNKVNISQVKALIRELQEEETIDLAAMGLHEVTRAIIKKPREKKGGDV